MKRKVAIYARVSTEHEAQLSALDNQVQYYDGIIKQHPDWILSVKGRESTEKRKQYVLDLTREDVQNYIIESVSNILSLKTKYSIS
mgnify:CR=1 FL=1